MKRHFVFIGLIITLVVFGCNARANAQDGQERTGVSVIENGTVAGMEYWSRDLINAIPQEWRVVQGKLPRYQITLTPSLHTSTCRYINTGDITLRTVSALAEIIDLATGQQVDHRQIESNPLGCPTRLGDGTESVPNAAMFQQWVVDVLQGRPGIAVARLPVILRDTLGAVGGAVFSPDGQLVLTKSQHGITLWDAHTGNVQRRFTYVNLRNAVFSPDSQSILMESAFSHTAGVWDIKTGEQRQKWDFESINDAFYMPNGQSIVFYNMRTIVVVDTVSGLKTMEMTQDPLFAVSSTPDSQFIVVLGVGGVKLWNLQTREVQRQISGDLILNVAFSSDGRLIVTGEARNTIKVRDAQTGSELWSISFDMTPVASFSPDGRRLLTLSKYIVSLWDATTGKEVVRLKDEPSKAFGFSPNGQLIATSSTDSNMVQVRNAETGKSLLKLSGHTKSIFAVSFSSDGRSLLTSSQDGTTGIWNISDLVAIP